jgi:hypothetical protein
MTLTLTRFVSASLISIVAISTGCSSSPEGATTDGGTDGAGAPIGFQPSNINISEIQAAAAAAQDEDVTGACVVHTDSAGPMTDCFTSPIRTVKQPDGSKVNLVVVKSLTLEKKGAMSVTGSLPFVVVSLADVTLDGTIDAHSASLEQGAGGAAGAQTTAKGSGAGGGAAGSASKAIAGSGGSYCGAGGAGGGQSAGGSSVGSIDIRPLVGGSAGGGGQEGSGSGGGGVQVVAAGALTIKSGSFITVGGAAGPFAGLATDQNAGGGGSGGSILLEATTIDVAGILAANGGGGGGAFAGAPASDATPNATPAPGGKAGDDGAAGGAGGAGSTPKGTAGKAGKDLNSGGGGGGAGRIRMNSVSGSASVTGTVSPADSTLCAIVAKVRTFSDGP